MECLLLLFVDKRNPMKGVDVGNPNLNLSFFLLKTFLSYIQSIFFSLSYSSSVLAESLNLTNFPPFFYGSVVRPTQL